MLGMKIRRLISACLIVILMISCSCACAYAPRFEGETLLLNEEQMREEHEMYIFKFLQSIAKYATDDCSSSVPMKYVKRGSKAATEISMFDGGWYWSHKSMTFADGYTENYQGDDLTNLSCDAYIKCGVKFTAGGTLVYDMAYHIVMEKENPEDHSETAWKITQFTNIATEPDTVDLDEINAMYEGEGIRVEPVTGATFKGYMLFVEDPSHITVGTISLPFSDNKSGWTLDVFAEKYDAIAAVNGGAFADPNGMGKGGKANGLVISQGKVIQGHNSSATFGTIMGFNQDNKLIVKDNISASTVEALGLRDALAFRPALIMDGKIKDNSDSKTFCPHTAIGQKADGTVLFLIIDGRQPDSFGATLNDVSKVMAAYGAINAGNLDGGTSTALVVNGMKINDGFSPTRVSRAMPTAFIIR